MKKRHRLQNSRAKIFKNIKPPKDNKNKNNDDNVKKSKELEAIRGRPKTSATFTGVTQRKLRKLTHNVCQL